MLSTFIDVKPYWNLNEDIQTASKDVNLNWCKTILEFKLVNIALCTEHLIIDVKPYWNLNREVAGLPETGWIGLM